MSSLGERMAAVALATFNALPLKSKPRIHPDGRREWIPMSAIVFATGAETGSEKLTCISLATGAKCLSISRIPKCRGMILHDSHAEILALRALNRFLLSEVKSLVEDDQLRSEFIRKRTSQSDRDHTAQPFELRAEVTVHMFSTEAPCGDASMDLLMESKSQEDLKPWPEPVLLLDSVQLHGRGYFSALGIVRRKPSRADAEPTLSKSCTDKLCMKQVTSILSFPANMFIAVTDNAFLKTIIIPAEKYNKVGFDRAFGSDGRLSKVSEKIRVSLGHPTIFFKVEVLPPSFPKFEYSKPESGTGAVATKVGNVSATWIKDMKVDGINETIVNGVKQGFKQLDDNMKKRSIICRSRMWEYAVQLLKLLNDPDILTMIEDPLSSNSYGIAKAHAITHKRAAAKEFAVSEMGGWMKNSGDEAWGLADSALLDS